MNGVIDFESDDSDFVEVDPTGRYGRYNEILGKGASKTVYKAFDEYEGIEVAWNQVKLYDFMQSPEDLERLYCEIHLLKTLKHKNIMKFYTSWVDVSNRNINFVTEMFTSGTLRQYRLKHKRVNIRAVKRWCRQILRGLHYLHSHDPPVIHRDLKCDNIFINGNQGEVKIGDLGLAAILRKSHAERCVGTPEFMAPEVYAEEYNELVDIYSFGMCILEMVTFDYPYSECTHPAQIYKKVTSGKKPDALYKVEDPEVRRFVEKCLATVSHRLSARELLDDPFLQIDDCVSDSETLNYLQESDELDPTLGQRLFSICDPNNSPVNGYLGYEPESDSYYHQLEYEANEIDLFTDPEEDDMENVDISIKGRRREDDGIFLRLRIADKEGRVRNIYFPFDVENDTALSVATEMVAELDITDQDVTKIADMIDGEIASLVPEWTKGFGIEESPNYMNRGCHNCASNGSLVNYLSSDGPRNLQVLHCSKHGCGAMHGRFEEIMYHLDRSEQCITDSAPDGTWESDGVHFTDIWAQHDKTKSRVRGSVDCHSDVEDKLVDESMNAGDEKLTSVDKDDKSRIRKQDSTSSKSSGARTPVEDYENEIRRELRWLKAKYQMQLRGLKDQRLGVDSKYPHLRSSNKIPRKDKVSSGSTPSIEKDELLLRSFNSGKHFSSYLPIEIENECSNSKVRRYPLAFGSCSPEHMATAQSFYTGALLPQSLHRATSLPVDAIDF
ncbi:probable serine/threonine-protein kinase WNK9 [Nicotiana tomentosiformis]|uniref:probable serine/threonine-protein kinase WNK9 n=1 Tax=Nicotiana tomentosiformis TaxID=4098 RepID=UPI00051C917D|nr:probable serine/threonine-protein kinase WNK9 [Nicotiana tomentosiformis]